MTQWRRKRGRHLRPYDLEAELHAAITEKAKERIIGSYSGHLSNGDSYKVDLTLLENFTMDMNLELTIIQ